MSRVEKIVSYYSESGILRVCVNFYQTFWIANGWFMWAKANLSKMYSVGWVDQDVLENTRADSMNTKQLGVYLHMIVCALCTYDICQTRSQRIKTNAPDTFCLHLLKAATPILSSRSSVFVAKWKCTMICMHTNGSDETRLSVVATGQKKHTMLINELMQMLAEHTEVQWM